MATRRSPLAGRSPGSVYVMRLLSPRRRVATPDSRDLPPSGPTAVRPTGRYVTERVTATQQVSKRALGAHFLCTQKLVLVWTSSRPGISRYDDRWDSPCAGIVGAARQRRLPASPGGDHSATGPAAARAPARTRASCGRRPRAPDRARSVVGRHHARAQQRARRRHRRVHRDVGEDAGVPQRPPQQPGLPVLADAHRHDRRDDQLACRRRASPARLDDVEAERRAARG